VRFLAVLPLSAALALAGCATNQSSYAAIDGCLAQAGAAWNYRFARCEPAATGPVDRIVVEKSQHWMTVYREGRIVREFRVALGRGGLQPKERAGDERVPEGEYTIDGHNPASKYHLSLRISYPTPRQSAAAAARGVSAGGDIMIHGLPNDRSAVGSRQLLVDWTDGCIALSNPEIDWLYRAVPDGTPIEIRA